VERGASQFIAYPSRYNLWIYKKRRRLVRFEARVGDMTNVLYRSLVGRHEGKKYVRDVGVDETIIMKWIVKK
jgi:hypothetical protein